MKFISYFIKSMKVVKHESIKHVNLHFEIRHSKEPAQNSRLKQKQLVGMISCYKYAMKFGDDEVVSKIMLFDIFFIATSLDCLFSYFSKDNLENLKKTLYKWLNSYNYYDYQQVFFDFSFPSFTSSIGSNELVGINYAQLRLDKCINTLALSSLRFFFLSRPKCFYYSFMFHSKYLLIFLSTYSHNEIHNNTNIEIDIKIPFNATQSVQFSSNKLDVYFFLDFEQYLDNYPTGLIKQKWGAYKKVFEKFWEKLCIDDNRKGGYSVSEYYGESAKNELEDFSRTKPFSSVMPVHMGKNLNSLII